MALSGSVNTSKYDGRYYQLSWTATQSVKDNTSTISWALKALGGNSGWYAERTLKVTIAGETVYSKTNRVERYTGTVKTGTVTITHGSDGSKSFAVNVQAAVYVTTVNCTASKTFTLDNIPRKSTLTVSNGTLGTAQTLKVTRQSSSFTHTIVAKCGSASKTICTKSATTSFSFTPPQTWANQNTTGMSVSVTYTITTYNGDTNLGSNSYTKTCAIEPYVMQMTALHSPDEDSPTYTKYNGYVQGVSKVKFEITPVPMYGATIKSITTTVDGRTYTGSEPTTEILSGSGTLPVKIVVTDSRGTKTNRTANITVHQYTSPKITSMSVIRSDVDGNSSSSGAYLTVKFKSEVSSLNNKNSATYTVKYKKSTASSYTSKTLSDYKDKYSVTDGKCTFAADTGSSYNVELTVNDNLGSAKKTAVGSSIKKLWSILKKGMGFAFGKVAELQNYLDVGFKTLFRDQVEFVNDKSITGTDINGTKYSALIPITASGNTSVGYGLYTAQKNSTRIYGYDVYLGVSNIASPGIFKPYFSQGDTIAVNIQTAGYLTDAMTEVHFTIPLNKPVFGTPTISLSSTDGFILRQENKYTHDSSATVRVKPSTYTAYAYQGVGVRVIAEFSTTTNALNNAPIGIDWTGTITLS